MTIRLFSRSLISLVLFGVVACGGANKSGESPAGIPDTDGPAKEDAPTSGNASSNSDGTSGEAPTGNAEEPSKAGSGGSAGDKTKIPEGLQLLDRRSLALDYNLNYAGGLGIQSGNWSFSEERTMRVKAARKDVITEMQVVYGKWDAKPLLGLTYEMPTDGKTYLLSQKDGSLVLFRGANEKLSPEEQKSVKAEYGWVGERSPLRKALLDSELKVGTTLSKSAELAQILLGEIPGADSSVTEVSATIDKLETASRKRAVLTVAAKTRVVSNKTLLDLELKGPVTVDVSTGWVLSAELAGTVAASGTVQHPKKKAPVEVSGKGKVTLTRSSEFH